ncbi:hypothetical protein SLNWT_7030 [Streptomyces albus]|uniref:Uncharacterized protein n=1 Tax=Streptomyces albus (strain ATCC 21838 / DSM 41398 / FERM P-419 / JCM 4703 / NBRC 107858) TaxID=1081613 RepID=A0A0B5F996_STRA4|nr:hypothetical protein SLNWT_7030 [Streptomyces albus]AOU81709.1 hypothetical protein SLNHY_7018 [Streptomyces albus]AYN37399.1 hypothetical protein DUI70_6906 [Streptomyces albus]
MPGAGAQRLEGLGGFGVALARPYAVGMLVERLVVEVGVGLAVGVPGGEDLRAVRQVVVEMPQDVGVRGRGGADGGSSCRFSGRRQSVRRRSAVGAGIGLLGRPVAHQRRARATSAGV